jgi:glycosyltransferase involved in cell wall biosynthesis
MNASGKFIFFIDADDELSPEGIDLLVKGFLRSGSPLIIGGFDRYNPAPMNSSDSLIFSEDRGLGDQDIENYVFRYLSAPNKNPLFVTTWGRLILAEVIYKNNLKFDAKMRSMEDVDFNFKLLAHIDSAYYVSRRIYKYRVYSSSESESTKALKHVDGVLGFVKALDSANNYLVTRGCDRAKIELSIGNAYVVYTIISLVRICLQWSLGNTRSVYGLCKALVFSVNIDKYRLQYRPGPRDSRAIPFLLALRSVLGVMLFCKVKAWIRYGFSR